MLDGPLYSGELELTAPPAPRRLERASGEPFGAARLLVRARGTPIGFIELATPGGRLDPREALEAARALAPASATAGGPRASAAPVSSPAPSTGVSVVLCTHDRATGAMRTLASLRAQLHPNTEIIVVDSAPSDDACRHAVAGVAALDARLRYLREPAPGLSRARNRGLAAAGGEVVAFTDDDVVADPLWLQGLLRGFERGGEVACVTGLVASASLEHPAQRYFDRRVWWSSSCEQRTYTPQGEPGDPVLYPYACGRIGTGANFALRTDVLRTVGGFDQCLGAGSATRGGEDLDMFARLLRHGFSVSYEPAALVWHRHRADPDSLAAQMFAYGMGLTGYLTKHVLAKRSRAAILRRLALGGAPYALALAGRAKHAGGEPEMGEGLGRAELRGMAAGPAAYLRARRAQDREHLRAVAP